MGDYLSLGVDPFFVHTEREDTEMCWRNFKVLVGRVDFRRVYTVYSEVGCTKGKVLTRYTVTSSLLLFFIVRSPLVLVSKFCC